MMEANSDELSIEDKLRQIASEIPRAEWDRLPADLTDRLDHYIYQDLIVR